VKVLV